MSFGAATKTLEGNTLNINQQTDKAILNWQSFNIGPDNTVNFNQRAGSDVALNRIYQNDPSRILGKLTATGQVYLINPNGILFGRESQVDVNSLVASTLDVPDAVFKTIGVAGAINQGNGDPTFVGAGPMGAITVETGADIRSASGGRIMIFAPQIDNRGSIQSNQGQTILAAGGDKIYLASSEDPNLRGLLVEVKTGGTVNNFGSVIADRGNVSLMGFAVNQNGLVRATTTASINGSIHLLARDQATTEFDPAKRTHVAVANRTGTVSLGQNSLTEVLPELDTGETAVDAQPQPRSQISLMGGDVRLNRGAVVRAPSGRVVVNATANPRDPAAPNTPANSSRVYMDSGSLIDVSGTTTTILPITQNQLDVELRGSELADSPVQRDGVLRGKKVTVDIRKGTPLANISGELAAIRRPLGERVAVGGSVSIRSEGDFILQDGATIDFSGGQVSYAGGVVKTTKLVSQGRIVDISAADPNVVYDGIFGSYSRTHKKWGVTDLFNIGLGGTPEPGYVEGRDAGSLELLARGAALNGTLKGNVTVGPWQRKPAQGAAAGFERPFDQVPLGGQLILGNASQQQAETADFYSPGIFLTNQPLPVAPQVTDPVLSSAPILLRDDLFNGTGINRVALYSNSRITLPEGVAITLRPGGQLDLNAGKVQVDGKITAPAAKVAISARLTNGVSFGASVLTLGSGGSIDVRGMWVNDALDLISTGATGPVFIDGGSVTIKSAGDVTLDRGSLIDVGGGAQFTAKGAVNAGRGGTVSVTTDQIVPTRLRLDGDIRGYALSEGGSLVLKGPGFRVGDSNSAGGLSPGDIVLSPGFFQSGGFGTYGLTATFDGIAVGRGVGVDLKFRNLQLNAGFSKQPTGSDMAAVSTVTLLPDFARRPVSLALTSLRNFGAGDNAGIDIGTGAIIQADPKASISLTTDTRMTIDGAVVAPAGKINLALSKPIAQNETGFIPDYAIWLAPHARLATPAAAILTPNTLGLRQGQVLAGGEINITADRGYIVTAPGSLMDVSGIAQMLDLAGGGQAFNGNSVATPVAGAAGGINLTAAEGILLNGELRGNAAPAPGAAGGRLSVTLDALKRETNTDLLPAQRFKNGPRDIIVGHRNSYVEPRQPVPNAFNGLAFVDPDKVNAGGFDVLSLRTQRVGLTVPPEAGSTAAIRFEGNVALTAGRSITLNTPVLASDGGAVSLAAPYVSLGSGNTLFDVTPAPASGTGRLNVSADFVDLVGTTSLQGFGGASPGAVTLHSAGDIRLRGVQIATASSYTGGFYSGANLTLEAAQVYPVTLSEFALSVAGPGQRLSIESTGTGAAPPLSAGGKLTLSAAEIDQQGVLRAPFGDIAFAASGSLNFGAGSLTSTAAGGLLIPFGQTQLGQDWVYVLSGLTRVFGQSPAKSIELGSPSVSVRPGASIDVSGGGDLLAYEFLPGPGGSTDILTANNPAGAFAILPSLHNLFSPFDPNESINVPGQVGDTVILSGRAGLPAGEYSILPARYALLPGAYLVTPVPKTQDIAPGQTLRQLDGTSVVAGKRAVAGTSIQDSRWSGFAVEDGASVRKRAEYKESLASDFFAAKGNVGELPGDAGSLTVAAGKSLVLQGALLSDSAAGRGARVDIVADRLAIVPARTGVSGRVELLAGDLNGFGAESLLLGGRRHATSDGINIDVTALDITVDRGAEVHLPELVLAATRDITVADGARLEGVGTIVRDGGATVSIAGQGALARVSTGGQVSVQRTTQPPITQGSLTIANGALLAAAGSITLDAGLATSIQGDLQSSGGSLVLSASHISLGETAGVSGGLVLSNQDLARLGAADLFLRSRETIDLYGALELALAHVRFDAAGIAGYGNDGKSASISAEAVEFANLTGSQFVETPTGHGELDINARNVLLDDGSYAIRGFSNVKLNAANSIEGSGSVDLKVSGDLTLQASRLTGASGANISVAAGNKDGAGNLTGSVVISAPNRGAELPDADSLGARLNILAGEIRNEGRIDLPSGEVRLHAQTGGITLASGSSVSVAGVDQIFQDVTFGTAGGHVELKSDNGAISVLSGASIVASGAAAGGAAGGVDFVAPKGVVSVDPAAQLAAGGTAGGALVLDAMTVGGPGITGLNALLNASAGFNDQRGFRLRSGDIVVGAGDVLRAHAIALTADAGRIEIAGHLDASGASGGRVDLNASGDVLLQPSARIDAQATATGKKGGTVALATTKGVINILAPSLSEAIMIDVAAASNQPGRGGRVSLRAPRIGANEVAIGTLAGRIGGAARIDAEAFKVYGDPGDIDNLMTSIAAQADAFMANASAIKNRLGMAANGAFHILPGVEIRNPGNLVISSNVDFLNWRSGGEPGVLTVRAGGDLTVQGSISDGVAFLSPNPDFFPERDVVQAGSSWAYRLVAGSDLTSADPLAVVSGRGNLALAAGQHIRTGTGSIDVATGGNLVLKGSSSAIYTVGQNVGDKLDPNIALLAEATLQGDFLDNGGDIRIAAAGNISAAPGQVLSDWVPRIGGTSLSSLGLDGLIPDLPALPTAWAINVDLFRQAVGALAGGSVVVHAGGDVEGLSAVIPTSGVPLGTHGENLAIGGGGDLVVDVAGDIRGGVYSVSRGTADIRAGGALTRSSVSRMYPVLTLADGRITVQASGSVDLETVFNPTVATQSALQGILGTTPTTYFFTYSGDSSVDLTSLSGDVVLHNRTDAITRFHGDRSHPFFSTEDERAFAIYPGSLAARSLRGNVVVQNSLTLFPAAHGQLELLADKDVSGGSGDAVIHMSDADPGFLPGPQAPAFDLVNAIDVRFAVNSSNGADNHAAPALHGDDPAAAEIVARSGIIGSRTASPLRLSLAKQARLSAGLDVLNLDLKVQQVSPRDVTVVGAGRDIAFPTVRSQSNGGLVSNSVQFEFSGPGSVDILAGRNVDLGTEGGLISIGNLKNPGLPEGGADITVVAGMNPRPAYSAFIDRYLVQSDAYRQVLADYMTAFPSDPGLSTVENFRRLPEQFQRKLIFKLFFNEIKESGVAATKTVNNDFSRGFKAIRTLFPGSAYKGDVRSLLSRIATIDGGDINILVPGGLVNAGAASAIGVANKSPDKLGIVVQKQGDISVFAKGDLQVNQSRVFALDGGNILVWSSEGDIDAGRGAKTALSIPPPVTTFDANGNAVTTFPPAVSGSGIRGAVSTPGRAPGDVFLFAPAGVVNAGDAGIGSAGNLTIAATQVIGAENISVGGVSVGVPTVNTSSLAAGLAGVGDVASAATKSVEQASSSGLAEKQAATQATQALATASLSFITVEVVGFGEN